MRLRYSDEREPSEPIRKWTDSVWNESAAVLWRRVNIHTDTRHDILIRAATEMQTKNTIYDHLVIAEEQKDSKPTIAVIEERALWILSSPIESSLSSCTMRYDDGEHLSSIFSLNIDFRSSQTKNNGNYNVTRSSRISFHTEIGCMVREKLNWQIDLCVAELYQDFFSSASASETERTETAPL